MISGKGYFDPSLITRQGDIKANQYRQNTDVLANLLQALAQTYGQAQQRSEANDFFNQSVTSTTPQQTVSTDLLGKPIGRSTTGYGGRPMFIPEPISGQTVSTTESVDQSFDPNTLLRGLMSANPEIQRRAQASIQGQQAMQPKYESFSPGTINRNVNSLYTGKNQEVSVPFKPTPPKKVGESTVNGRKVATFINPDNSTFKVDMGESFEGERLKLAKQNVELAKKRFEQVTDKDMKAEGKRLIDLFNKAEDQYNKNMIYMSDPNISEGTRNVLNEQQVSLANEMDAYGKSIGELGQTTNQVLTNTAPKSRAVKRTGKTKDGKKVIEYTDGTIEYQ